MSAGKAFFDTNVIVYLFDQDATKADRVEELLIQGGQISVQVLNELANVARRKLGLPWHEVAEISKQIEVLCSVTPVTVEMHAQGLQVASRYGLSVYDGMIISAALVTGCTILYTEDMQDGQQIAGQLVLRNPFATSRQRQ